MNDYPARHGYEWDIEEMLRLAELYLEPITWNTIARKMRRTESACQARLRLIRLACELSPHISGITVIKTIRRNKNEQEITEEMEKSILETETTSTQRSDVAGTDHRNDAPGQRNIDNPALRQ
jgi:hypothetical protein